MTNSTAPEPLLTTREVAEILGVNAVTLAKWRAAGTGPAFVQPAPRTVRYRPSAIDAWLDGGVHAA